MRRARSGQNNPKTVKRLVLAISASVLTMALLPSAMVSVAGADLLSSPSSSAGATATTASTPGDASAPAPSESVLNAAGNAVLTSAAEVTVVGVLEGDAETPSPAPTETPTETPTEQVGGATATPVQTSTPPPTGSVGDASRLGSKPQLALLICYLLAAAAVAVVISLRRRVRR